MENKTINVFFTQVSASIALNSSFLCNHKRNTTNNSIHKELIE